MADWQSLDREEQQDILAYEICRKNDQSKRVAERLDELRASDAKYEDCMRVAVIAIWQSMV